MRSAFVYPLFVLTGLLAAYAQEPVDRTTNSFELSDSIQPRKSGAYWLYKSVYFEAGKAVSNGTTKEEVVAVAELEGVTCWQIKLTMDWRSIVDRLAGAMLTEDDYDYFWEYFNAQGSFHFGNLECDTNQPDTPKQLNDFSLTLPYPTTRGHRYEADGDFWEVLDDELVLEVPAGTFTCVLYQSVYEDPEGAEFNMRNRFYMCQGVGMIRFESDMWIDNAWELDIQDSLIKYDLQLPASEPMQATE